MSKFSMRTSCPGNYNKNFMRTANGGWNTCIQGNPCKADANVLANCVGYASGRFNEIINEARDTTGCTYKTLNCNAENFVERAVAAGLRTGSTPRKGAIMCWQKGSLSSGDGAGHVAIVERVDSNGQVYTSESGYGSSYFWNQTRNNSNGRWGIGSAYLFRCFIYLPDDVQKIIDENPQPTPQPTPSDKFNIGDDVVLNGPIYVSSNASSPANTIKNKITKVTRKNPGSAHPYNTTGDLGWCDESSLSKYEPAPTPTPEPPKPQPTPVGPKFAVGQKVKINIKSSGYAASADGTGQGGRRYKVANGWVRLVLKYHSGKPFPYQVGNATGTTGFFKEEDLQAI